MDFIVQCCQCPMRPTFIGGVVRNGKSCERAGNRCQSRSRKALISGLGMGWQIMSDNICVYVMACMYILDIVYIYIYIRTIRIIYTHTIYIYIHVYMYIIYICRYDFYLCVCVCVCNISISIYTGVIPCDLDL